MTRSLYLAAPSEFADRAEQIGAELAKLSADVAIVSRWHRTSVPKYPTDASARADAVAMNIADMDRATHFVLLTDMGTPRSAFAELGYALGRGLRVVWVVGDQPEQRCIFDAHVGVLAIKVRIPVDELDPIGAIAAVLLARLETS